MGEMYEWIIIDGEDVSRFNAKRIKAVHPTAIDPVRITRVTAVQYEGELNLIIHTDRKVRIEDCVDRGCKHLVEEIKKVIMDG